jgi:hypothetical protein
MEASEAKSICKIVGPLSNGTHGFSKYIKGSDGCHQWLVKQLQNS